MAEPNTMPNSHTTSVLFVCLGNICRSPVARAIFEDLTSTHGLIKRYDIDSCGTGAWHIGRPADPRSVLVAANHGLNLTHTARQLDPDSDFTRFHYLVGMDQANCSTMLELGAPREKVRMLRSFDPALATRRESELDVPDPYYGGPDGFEHMYQMIRSACEGLLASTR